MANFQANPKPKFPTARQQNLLISLMRTFAPPDDNPRTGPSLEYSDDFWTNAAQQLNRIESSDKTRWRDKKQWRQMWKHYENVVKRKIKYSEKMTRFEEQVANVLFPDVNNSSTTFTDDQLGTSFEQSCLEDENSTEVMEVEPDVSGISRSEPVPSNSRAASIGEKRHRSAGQANISVPRSSQQNETDIPLQPIPATNSDNAHTSRAQTRSTTTTVDQTIMSSNQQIKLEPETSVAQASPSTSWHNAGITQSQNKIKIEPATLLNQPSISPSQYLRTEPDLSPNQPSISTNRKDANITVSPQMSPPRSSNIRQNPDPQKNNRKRKLFEKVADHIKRAKLHINEAEDVFQQLLLEEQQTEPTSNNHQNGTEQAESNSSSNPQASSSNQNSRERRGREVNAVSDEDDVIVVKTYKRQ